MKHYLILTVLTLCTLLTSCSSRDDDGGGLYGIDCLNLGTQELDVTIQESFTTLPSKVSVFFKVNDQNGNAVPGLTPSNFTIFEKGRNDDCYNEISSSEASGTISPNAQIFSNNTFLVLDLSNSVLSTSLDELKQASSNFISNVMPAIPSDSFKMGIYWFDGEDVLHELQPLTTSATTLQQAIDGIDTSISNDPSTDLYGAVIKATEIAEGVLDSFDDQDLFAAASIVLFTDGTDQAARYTEVQAIAAVNEADEDLSFFTIGLGSEIDEDILSDIGQTGSAFATSAQDLETVFNDISNGVAGQANSFYLFEYCSPKRDGSGNNNLVIQVVDGDRDGVVQTSFDAQGFTGGCN
ncbi:vWA domain-containing protein [Dokdonia sp. Hel_I_53]|uniref:vWA domain-containing protein n=1 Tax=Dokdonia sp. Hel_I_53 TaxID=1566287 RepID=UPI001199226E|nr:VWA domain-containing protein [Dokdonia sp. Hel_I_53]TVZ51608.1 von Willebrand factor type A domain-containing protein [Dokdonia sp. Hel_I_53]